MRTDGTRMRVHRVDVDVVARFERDGSIVSVCVQRLDGRSFPVDEVLEAAPFSGPPCTAGGRPVPCQVRAARDRAVPRVPAREVGGVCGREARVVGSCGRCWRGAPSSRAEIDVEQVEQERDYRIRFASKEKAGSHAVLRIHSVFLFRPRDSSSALAWPNHGSTAEWYWTRPSQFNNSLLRTVSYALRVERGGNNQNSR